MSEFRCGHLMLADALLYVCLFGTNVGQQVDRLRRLHVCRSSIFLECAMCVLKFYRQSVILGRRNLLVVLYGDCSVSPAVCLRIWMRVHSVRIRAISS